MKSIAKILAVVAMLTSLNALAADPPPPPRKEAVMDTGENGMRLMVSVPDFVDGPYDFSRNKGPVVTSQPEQNRVVGEVMFTLALGESALVSYQSSVTRLLRLQSGNPGLTAEGLAEGAIRQAGFAGRAIKFECPSSSIEGASTVCYRMSGSKMPEGKAGPEKSAHALFALSFEQGRQGYLLMVTITERDAALFDSNPVRYEKIVWNGLADLLRNHKAERR